MPSSVEKTKSETPKAETPKTEIKMPKNSGDRVEQLRQRRELLREIHRSPAGGIARRAAPQPANGVDGGKSDRRADQHGADGQRDPARGSSAG